MRESVRADHDPRAELVCVSKKSSGEKRYGITKGLAHECCRATQRRRFFDTFPDPILPDLSLVADPTDCLQSRATV